ncbi:uncharacterized protein LOC125602408 [Brassica napus]|uniref:uncharacterized protein LOC125602408 n=1 Tax=Brassica napus TaxID=3708 RepID=UPI0020791D69|nr:uncharacterized protein LOC125602408 [Brassica napus]
MTTDFRAWKVDNPAPASIMIISDELASSKYRLSLICRKLQKSNYNCFLVYSVRPFEMSVLLTSAEWLWESLLSGACFLFVLSCVTKTWARNYPATPEHATAKIHVLWDMNDCPIPEGYDACRVRPSIERALKELGYTGPVSITAFADQKQTPDHHLLALSSTGVVFAHTLFPWDLHSRMITDCEEWIEDNPAPATVMIISDELASPKSHSSLLCRKLQESNYNCFLAYSVRPFEKPILVWDSLLAGVCSLIFHYYITTKLITLSFFFFPPQFQRQKETFFTSAVKVKVKVKGLQHLPECFVAHCATVIAKASMVSISISQVKIIHRKYAHPLPSPSLSIDCLTI